MATITATIFIGRGHQNSGGINPSHLMLLSENSRPALILISLETNKEIGVVIPTVENMVDDIFLYIATEILGKIDAGKKLYSDKKDSLYDMFTNEERNHLYERSKNAFTDTGIKVVFNILDGSSLLGIIDTIKDYPCDIEITQTSIKREFNRWSNKTETNGFYKS